MVWAALPQLTLLHGRWHRRQKPWNRMAPRLAQRLRLEHGLIRRMPVERSSPPLLQKTAARRQAEGSGSVGVLPWPQLSSVGVPLGRSWSPRVAWAQEWSWVRLAVFMFRPLGERTLHQGRGETGASGPIFAASVHQPRWTQITMGPGPYDWRTPIRAPPRAAEATVIATKGGPIQTGPPDDPCGWRTPSPDQKTVRPRAFAESVR